MKTIQSSRLLKLALYADAAASVSLAGLQLLLPSLLSDRLSLPAGLLTGTGIFLVGYTLMLVLLARAHHVWAVAVQFIILGNVGWAIACLALAETAIVSPSGLGVAFLVFQAVAVLAFAALEYAGLRASIAQAPATKLHFQ
jgi:hypothetical protein